MNLYSQTPFWLLKDGIIQSYPSQNANIKTDVAIIGGGISAALTAYYLRNSGLGIAIFDRRHIGMGSTAASTAFLQYEIDTPLQELRRYVGEQNAVESYLLCRNAIYEISAICRRLHPSTDFHIRPSLQFASFKKHRESLYEEYLLRRRYNFDVRWLEQKDISGKFGLDAPAAIFSEDGGEVDAYMLAHALVAAVKKKGHRVFTNTDITRITHHKRSITLHSESGFTTEAKKLVIACGYESMNYLPKKVAKIQTTYALVSEPIAEQHSWHRKSLVWETATPYLYFRMLNKDRVLIGGKDDPFHRQHTLNSRIKIKTESLCNAFSQRMKNIVLRPDFSWSGAFAVTEDGLPYIGCYPGIRNTYFALGFGGNGITFSVIAAAIIRDLLTGKKNRHINLFRFNR